MAEYEEISREAATIINSFVEKSHAQGKYGGKTDLNSLLGEYLSMRGVNLKNDTPLPTYEEFVVSLYAMTPNADSNVLQKLDEYRVDLTKTLSLDEVNVLLREFKAVVRRCSERDFLWWPSKSLSYALPTVLIDFCYSVVADYCSAVVADHRHRIFNHGVQRTITDGNEALVKTEISGDVLFPFADDIQFACGLSDCSFDVYEPDSRFWAFGRILKDAYLRNCEIRIGGSSENTDGKSYDYVFSCPILRKDVRSVADELYNIAATRLKDNGVMCCLLPESFCYAPEWYGLRKILIDKKAQYSTLVISLPDVLQPYVTGNICLFCLFKPIRDTVLEPFSRVVYGDVVIKDKDYVTDDVELREKWIDGEMDKVVLVNAKSNDFLEDGFYEEVLMCGWDEYGCLPNVLESYAFNWQLVLDAISTNNKKFMWSGRSTDLTDNVSLLPARYLVREFSPHPTSDEIWVKLGEVIDLVKPSAHKHHEKDEKVLWLESGSLSTNHLNCDISCDGLGTRRDDMKRYSKISEVIFDGDHELYDLLDKSFSFGPDRLNEKCLVVSHSNGRLKVGRVVDTSLPYELSPEIIAFKVRSDKVSEDFLLRSLMSDNVAKQAMALSWGGFYSSIDPKDFLQIEIILPSLEEQEWLCREEVRKSLSEAERKLRDAFEGFRKDTHVKMHSIGQDIFELDNLWDNLQYVREKNNGILRDDAIVDSEQELTVGKTYKNLRNVIKCIQNKIQMFDRGNSLKAERLELTSFIVKYIEGHKTAALKFRYDASDRGKVLPNRRKVVDEVWVYFPEDALKMVFDDIVSNARHHGFSESATKNNMVLIEHNVDDESVVVTVSNNGKPLDDGFSPDNVLVYGKSSVEGRDGHFGLGGYEVKQLMQEFGGDVEVISTPSAEFTVSYKLTLPREGHVFHA